ncbi:helix-turn-helix transcriptional regulator, TetR family [Geotalea daltonii FRC-32]|uniref:Helix-turn-helix transcriptional regulator, TetR family n=1 Tax=Geotalea daltonii (strain DSM 22248 / JCM 15807 / FRC-32) TaxID=316067 RepID=B9M4C3_GEODF|nr:TetR/AcrR family transcriptional regulator [Geotalea daltonii]ACM21578.1 helix-turn-helix transcriptional regulator, TetR family [Geotalea daltonii FRC-32]
MGLKERRQRHKNEFKAEILEAALALFVQEGYNGFSMRKLASRIEYSPTTIYLYFRDKDDLLLHICENFYANLLQEQLQGMIADAPPEQHLRQAFLCYVSYSLKHPELYKVVFFSNPQLYGKPEDYLSRDTMSLRCWKQFCELVDNCIKSGYFRHLDCYTLSTVLWSAMHGLVTSTIFTKDFPMPDPAIMTEMMLDGIFSGYRADHP